MVVPLTNAKLDRATFLKTTAKYREKKWIEIGRSRSTVPVEDWVTLGSSMHLSSCSSNRIKCEQKDFSVFCVPSYFVDESTLTPSNKSSACFSFKFQFFNSNMRDT